MDILSKSAKTIAPNVKKVFCCKPRLCDFKTCHNNWGCGFDLFKKFKIFLFALIQKVHLALYIRHSTLDKIANKPVKTFYDLHIHPWLNGQRQLAEKRKLAILSSKRHEKLDLKGTKIKHCHKNIFVKIYCNTNHLN